MADKIKVVFVKASGTYKRGDAGLIDLDKFQPGTDAGLFVSEGEWKVMAKRHEDGKALITRTVEDLVTATAIAPAQKDAVIVAALSKYESGNEASLIVQLIQAENKRITDPKVTSNGRVTDPADRVEASVLVMGRSLKDSLNDGYVKAREPMDKLIKAGSWKEVSALAKLTGQRLQNAVSPILAKGGNFVMEEVFPDGVVRAADDVDSNVGTLNTGMVMLVRTFGFLKNKLTFLDKITTDLRNEAVQFGQNCMTRYITPPGVLTFVPGIGMTSDIDTINNWKNTITAANPAGTSQVLGATNTTSAGGGAQYSGTQFVVTAASTAKQTRSTPSATDVSIVLNQYKGVSIQFNNLTLSSTLRNLPGEQYDAQLYSLTEQINKDFLTTMFGSTWTGVSTAPFSLAGGQPVSADTFGLKNIITIKNKFTLNKMPDVGRFVLLQSVYHDALLTDSNLLTAKAILSLIKKDTGSFEDGELPVLFGVKVLESQLAAYKAGALVTITDGTTIQNTASTVGLAGNSATGLFVARLPKDYNTILGDIPPTASLEVVTEPDSGLSMLVKKRVDHNLEQTYVDCGLMYNFAQGDPRQGFLLNP